MKVYEVVSNLINKNVIRPHQINNVEDTCASIIFNHSFDCAGLSCKDCYDTEMKDMYKRK